MKKYGLAIVALLAWAIYIVVDFHASFEFDNTIESYWNLSEKASTLPQKTAYLDQFVKALDDAHLSGSSSWLWTTPDNDYSQNYIALKSLQTRMSEIQNMDVKSFEYQQAISQITAQEQGEASHLLSVFKAVWFRNNHPLLWGPFEFLFSWGGVLLLVVLFVVPADERY